MPGRPCFCGHLAGVKRTLLRYLHLKAAWTVQYLRSEVDIQGVFHSLVGKSRCAEPTEFGAGLLHRPAAVDILPAKGEDILGASDTIQHCCDSSHVCTMEVMEAARPAGIAHFHETIGRGSQSGNGVQGKIAVGTAFGAQERTPPCPLAIHAAAGAFEMD